MNSRLILGASLALVIVCLAFSGVESGRSRQESKPSRKANCGKASKDCCPSEQHAKTEKRNVLACTQEIFKSIMDESMKFPEACCKLAMFKQICENWKKSTTTTAKPSKKSQKDKKSDDDDDM